MMPPLIIDSFAGGGGASEGILQALGRGPDIAINHDAQAVAMHATNHPETRHICKSVYAVDLAAECAGQPVGLLWASPDCTHHSKAKGGQPRETGRRDLARVVVEYAAAVRPSVVALENVEEFRQWGPLDWQGKPVKDLAGIDFRRWVNQLRQLGYRVEWHELRACDYGAPTIRKRLFVVARCDGRPIVWPEPTHGAPDSPEVVAGRLQPWRTAAEIIDWSLPCPSIFERKRPLAEATMRRIARGVVRYVLESGSPYIVGCGGRAGQSPPRGVGAPYQTVTTKADACLVAPTLIQSGYGERDGQAPRVPGLDKPIGTVVAGGQKHDLGAAFLATHYGGKVGRSLAAPTGTVTTADHHSLVIAFLQKYYGSGGQDQPLGEPLHTVPTRDRFGLVTVTIGGEPYIIADIGMRMLSPRELFRAQGFRDDYVIDVECDGRRLSKAAQVRMCGNSVCPALAEALVTANCPELATTREAVSA